MDGQARRPPSYKAMARGKGEIEIVENLNNKKIIFLKKLIGQYKKSNLSYKLPIILGKNEEGKSEFADLVSLKHILMSGSTGSGKSMLEHTIISTFVSLFSSNQLRLYLVDMKLVELYCYENLTHLLAPVAPANRHYNVDKVFVGLEWLIEEKNRRSCEKKLRR